MPRFGNGRGGGGGGGGGEQLLQKFAASVQRHESDVIDLNARAYYEDGSSSSNSLPEPVAPALARDAVVDC